MGLLQNAVLDTGTRRLTKDGLAALSGPVRTYKPGEIEWCRSQQTMGRQSRPGISINRRGVGISVAAHELMGRPSRVNLGYDPMARAIIIQPSPEGTFTVGAKDQHSPKFGGSRTAEWLQERGFGPGPYPAKWDGQRLVVEAGRKS